MGGAIEDALAALSDDMVLDEANQWIQWCNFGKEAPADMVKLFDSTSWRDDRLDSQEFPFLLFNNFKRFTKNNVEVDVTRNGPKWISLPFAHCVNCNKFRVATRKTTLFALSRIVEPHRYF